MIDRSTCSRKQCEQFGRKLLLLTLARARSGTGPVRLKLEPLGEWLRMSGHPLHSANVTGQNRFWLITLPLDLYINSIKPTRDSLLPDNIQLVNFRLS